MTWVLSVQGIRGGRIYGVICHPSRAQHRAAAPARSAVADSIRRLELRPRSARRPCSIKRDSLQARRATSFHRTVFGLSGGRPSFLRSPTISSSSVNAELPADPDRAHSECSSRQHSASTLSLRLRPRLANILIMERCDKRYSPRITACSSLREHWQYG